MISVNLFDRCNINHRIPHTHNHNKLGRCWGCMQENLPKTIQYVTNGSGILDIFRNECITTDFKYSCTNNKILWIREARSIDSSPYKYVKDNYKYLFNEVGITNIYTWDEELLDVDDRVKWTFGTGSTILENDMKLYEKENNISMLASNKQKTDLQKIRLQLAKKLVNEIDVFGSSVGRHLPSKLESLKSYRFCITIENEISGMAISEKIIDCFLTGTVPVYLGSALPTRLGFCEEGVIRWNDNIDMKTLTKELYAELYPYVKQNYKTALKYINAADYTFGEQGFYWSN